MTSNDIMFYHSGGLLNNDPELDLGGDASAFQLSPVALNNLFNDLTAKESRYGLIDYRCIYIFNDHSTETLRNAKVFLDSQVQSGSHIEIGADVKDEIQKVSVSGTPNEGENMELAVDGSNFIVDYHPNTTIWKGNFQTEIRGIDGMNDVIVEVAGEVPSVTFTVNFLGNAASRSLSNISVVSSSLGDGTITPTIAQTQDGSPINTTAPTILTKTHIPSGVNFNMFLRGNAIKIGNLKAGEGFPLWIKRTTPAGTFKKTNDNFVLTLSGGAA